MIPLLAASLLLAAPAPASAAPAALQTGTRTVSCNLTIANTLHRGDDCVLRRISADREELRGGDLRLQIVYRSQGAGRRQVTLNGHPGSQSPLSGMEGVSGITADAFGPNSIAYQWWVANDDQASENDSQEQAGSGWSQ